MMTRTTRHNQWLVLTAALLLGARLQAPARAVADNLHQQLQAVSNALAGVRGEFSGVVTGFGCQQHDRTTGLIWVTGRWGYCIFG
jgi:hypothetical protein